MEELKIEAIKLSEFIKNYVPSGWKEPIGKVCFVKSFNWYEIEARGTKKIL